MDNPNDNKAEQFLEAAYPGLAHIQRMIDRFDIDYSDVVDYLYAIKMIKTHGFGIVQTHVNNGSITKLEATMRTFKQVETVKMVERNKFERGKVDEY